MKFLNYSIVVSIICLMQGCSIYHAPWEKPYTKAPSHKEAQVYHAPVKSVNNSNIVPNSSHMKAPVLNEKTNRNNSIKNTKVQDPKVKTETAFKEKVITISKPRVNEMPKVSEVSNFQKNESMPDDDHILIIPIE